ncbi:hypothetical protein KBB85_02050 [Patescibacteria group bacterium]|nr:hypothetical protein [Patescibacteria group bacterium]
MRFLKQKGYLRSGGIGGTMNWSSTYGGESSAWIASYVGERDGHLQVRYTRTGWDGEKENMDYQVRIVSTVCQFGGRRYWFICPLIRDGIPCGRRIGVLYMGGKYFGCRRCYDLAYSSQQDTHSGFFGLMGRTIFGKLDEKEAAMRVKYWNGRPTKRYARLLRKLDRMPSADALVMAQNALFARLRK